MVGIEPTSERAWRITLQDYSDCVTARVGSDKINAQVVRRMFLLLANRSRQISLGSYTGYGPAKRGSADGN